MAMPLSEAARRPLIHNIDNARLSLYRAVAARRLGRPDVADSLLRQARDRLAVYYADRDAVVAAWRGARSEALEAGAYMLSVPPWSPGTCWWSWAGRDWCNAVRFFDPSLRGFDDGSRTPGFAPHPAD